MEVAILRSSHYSAKSWSSESLWTKYLLEMQSILSELPSHLDCRDPVLRPFTTIEADASFIANFDGEEASRYAYWTYRKTNVFVSITHYREECRKKGAFNAVDVFARSEEDPEIIGKIFELGTGMLGSFYGYADYDHAVISKKYSDRAVDFSAELPGIFWRTFFGAEHCDFLGWDRIRSAGVTSADIGGGISISLGAHPGDVTTQQRTSAEDELGGRPFVGHGIAKPRGLYVPLIEQLS